MVRKCMFQNQRQTSPKSKTLSSVLFKLCSIWLQVSGDSVMVLFCQNEIKCNQILTNVIKDLSWAKSTLTKSKRVTGEMKIAQFHNDVHSTSTTSCCMYISNIINKYDDYEIKINEYNWCNNWAINNK